MKIIKNVGLWDRVVRLIAAEVFFLGAFFWSYGALQILLYVLSFVMLATSLLSYCGLYSLVKINTNFGHNEKLSKTKIISIIFTAVVIAILGSYYSVFFTKKIFLEDFNKMNNYYKQTLFYTGQNKRDEAVSNYANLVKEYNTFYSKYVDYRPYVISSDKKFNSDIDNVKNIVISLQDGVANGDLPTMHKEFEKIRPIFQDILKRNGFSMLAVYLVDFHDAMEKIIDAANVKNSQGVISVYQEVSDKLKAVEDVANDEEIQMIRQKLEQVVTSARNGDTDILPSQAAELKSSFVKVYLKRG